MALQHVEFWRLLLHFSYQYFVFHRKHDLFNPN
jgi:hypothetical protein